MKHERFQIKHGYNTVCVQGIRILTIKLRVKTSFPFDELPNEFRVDECKVQSNKLISYAGIDTEDVRRLIKDFTDLVLQHKIDEVYKNHSGHLPPSPPKIQWETMEDIWW